MEKELFKQAMNLIKEDNTDALMEILQDDNPYSVSLLLCYAAEVNSVNTLALLLSSADVMPDICNNYAIRIANKKGNTKCVELLAADTRVDAKVLEITIEEENTTEETKEPVEAKGEELDDVFNLFANNNDQEPNKYPVTLTEEELKALLGDCEDGGTTNSDN